MIRVSRDLSVNPQHVMSMEWERRHYAMGPGDSVLIIRMVTGHEHRVRHEPDYLDGTDCYRIEREISKAVAAQRAQEGDDG